LEVLDDTLEWLYHLKHYFVGSVSILSWASNYYLSDWWW